MDFNACSVQVAGVRSSAGADAEQFSQDQVGGQGCCSHRATLGQDLGACGEKVMERLLTEVTR